MGFEGEEPVEVDDLFAQIVAEEIATEAQFLASWSGLFMNHLSVFQIIKIMLI